MPSNSTSTPTVKDYSHTWSDNSLGSSSVFVRFDIAAGSGPVPEMGSGIRSMQCVRGGWLGLGSGEGLVISFLAGQMINGDPLFTT